MMWRPISTAPKNKDIWVCGRARLWANSDKFIWQGQAGFQDGKWIATSFDDEGNALEVRPTHWKELPKIPKSLEKRHNAMKEKE